jgi:hypothetical protein
MTDIARTLIETKFPNYDKSRVDAILERASETSKKKDGVGIALVTGSALDSLINVAEWELRHVKQVEKQFSDDELERVRLAMLGWGKAGRGAPLKHRGEFARKYGEAAAAAEDAKWRRKNPVDKGMLAKRVNPYKKVPGLKKALRGDDNPLPPTSFNQQVHGVLPPAKKLPKDVRKSNPFMPGPSFSLTRAGELFKADPATARQLAALAGVKI